MYQFLICPLQIFASFKKNRGLIFASAKREILGRYRGSVFGMAWSFFNPLLMLGVYTFIFSRVFKMRWNVGGGDSTIQYAFVLFSGLLIFNLFAECFSRAPGLILSNPSFVKKVAYPLEILPFVSLLAGLYHFGISLLVWIFAYILIWGIPYATILYIPLILLPFSLFILGVSWIFASLGVYVRDLVHFTSAVISVLMFVSPVFFPISAFPEAYRSLLYLNPLTPAIEMTRDVLCWGIPPGVAYLGLYLAVTSVIACIGFAWFQKTRKGFADVI